jgi:lipopolysaccharide transport system ATP-binding protein
MEPIVIVSGLCKSYSINETNNTSLRSRLKKISEFFHHDFNTKASESIHWALKGVTFTVNRGDRIGIIGKNGAGKSTLLKIMSRVSYPTAGEVRIRGTLTSLLEVGTGFNDNLSGRENVFLNASLYGMTLAEVERKFDDIVAFSEVGRFIDTPVKHYSSGMRMRLAFSVAAHLEPDILMLDEVLAVGDMSFQRKCLERVDDLTSHGQTLFFVSHSMDSIMRYCNRCIWLDDGLVRMDGEVQDVISAYVEAVLSVKSETNANDLCESPQNSSTEKHNESGPSVSRIGENPANELDSNKDTYSNLMGSCRLISARIIDSLGSKKSLFLVSDPVGIEMTYEVMQPGVYLPAVHVYCPLGKLLFVATPPETELTLFKKSNPCKIISTAWIPQHILNVGTYTVSLVLFSPLETPFRRYFIHEKALSFHSIEVPVGVRSAKGLMPREFPGPVRPLLNWTHQEQLYSQ